MAEDDLVGELEDIGLTEYQSRAYVAAVALGNARFSELADESSIPQQRIYDVVYDLDELGLLEVHEGSQGKEAVAPPPEVVLTELKRQRIEQFTTTFDTLADQLQRRYQATDTSSNGFVTVVTHDSSVRRHIEQAVQSAEWWLFLSLPVDLYEAITEEVRAALDRDVTVRLLVQGADVSPDDVEIPDGVLVRHRPAADVVVAADREYGVFRGIASPSVSRPSLVTRNENIVEMLQRYSEQFWAASRRIRERHRYPRRYLTPWRALVDVEQESPTGVTAYVEGHDTSSGLEGVWEGRIVDYELQASGGSDFSVVLPEVARLTLETGDGTVTVGGWDATLEDVAAHGLELRR